MFFQLIYKYFRINNKKIYIDKIKKVYYKECKCVDGARCKY